MLRRAKRNLGMSRITKALFGVRLAERMKKAGVSKIQLGEGLKPPVSYEAVRQWCKGEILPDLSKIEAIARLAKTTPEYLLLGFSATKEGGDADAVRTLQRIANDEEEMQLLTLYRTAGPDGKSRILHAARAYQLEDPAPANVVPISQRTIRRRKR